MSGLCPTCRRPAAGQGNRSYPFCSERCKRLDLGRWAAEDYRIPGEKPLDEESEDEEAEGDSQDKPDNDLM